MIPTGRLAAVSAVLTVALAVSPVRSWWAFGLAVSAVVLLFGLDGAATAAPGSMGVRRVVPTGVTLGTESEISWTIENPHDRPMQVALADDLWPSFGAPTRRVTASVPARSAVRATVRIRPQRRGRFPVDELSVRVTGPLGLTVRQQRRELPDVVRVFPAFTSRDEIARRLRRARRADAGVRTARERGVGTDFDQLRDYGPDDEIRRLDWAATARLGRPIVRTYRTERNQNVVALLDNGRVMAGTVDGVARVEHAMDAVLALATVAKAVGDRFGLVAFDRQVRTIVVPSSAGGQLSRVTEAMYQLEPELDDSAYGAAFAETAHRFRRRSLLVVFTDFTEASVVGGLLPALPALGRRHLVLVAGVQDPLVAGWARGQQGEGPDLTARASAFREAAAVAALERRRRAAALVAATGAVVVDEPVGRLAGSVVETYLDLKASGRL